MVELLSTVAILTVVAALTMAAVSKGVQKVERTSCVSNLKQLQITWQMYSDDSDGVVPVNRSYLASDGWRSTPDSWIGNSSAPLDKDTTRIKSGLMFRYDYNRSLRTYQCPSDDSTVVGLDILRTRSYSMNGICGGNYEKRDEVLRHVKRVAQIKNPSQLFVLIDENEDSIDDAHFLVWPTPDKRWANMPATRHGKLSTFSFADGHVEIVKWKWSKDFRSRTDYFKAVENIQDLSDLRKLQSLSLQ